MPTTFPRLYRTFSEKENILAVPGAYPVAEFLRAAEPLDTRTVKMFLQFIMPLMG